MSERPVVIAWSDEQEFPELAGAVAGIGGGSTREGGTGRRYYVTGGIALDSSAARVSTDPSSGAVRIERGGVTEIVQNRASGVEQSWRLAERPAVDGDLVFEVAVQGPRFAGETDGGLHFAAAGGPGARRKPLAMPISSSPVSAMTTIFAR